MARASSEATVAPTTAPVTPRERISLAITRYATSSPMRDFMKVPASGFDMRQSTKSPRSAPEHASHSEAMFPGKGEPVMASNPASFAQ